MQGLHMLLVHLLMEGKHTRRLTSGLHAHGFPMLLSKDIIVAA